MMSTETTPQPPAPTAGAALNDHAAECWIRPPSGGNACPHTGLKHAAFYREFVGNPRIRQARMGTGKDRGTRLLLLSDVHAEILRRANEQANEVSEGVCK